MQFSWWLEEGAADRIGPLQSEADPESWEASGGEANLGHLPENSKQLKSSGKRLAGVLMRLLETLPGPSAGGWGKGGRLEGGKERRNIPQRPVGDSQEIKTLYIGPRAHTAGPSV